MTEPKGRIRLCGVDDVDAGKMLGVDVEGLPRLAVYRVADEFYCTEDLCTHGAASLSEDGTLCGHVVECGWHSGRFDIRSGKACAAPCYEPLRSFPVTVEDRSVYIDVA